MGIQSRFCTYELRAAFFIFGDSREFRLPLESCDIRRAAAPRRRRASVGARAPPSAGRSMRSPRALRSTALDGYEASHGDGGDTSDARRVDAHFAGRGLRAPSPRRRLPSATSSASATRFSCASSTVRSAPRRLTRRLPSRASPSAPPRERASRSSTGWPMPPRRSPRRARRRARRARASRTWSAPRRLARPRSRRRRARGSPRPWRRREPEGTRVSAPPRTPSPRRTTPRLRRMRAARASAAAEGAPRGAPGHFGSRCRKRARGPRRSRAAERSHIVGGRDRACERAGGVRGRAASAGARRQPVAARRGSRWGGGWLPFRRRYRYKYVQNAPRRRRPGRRHPADRGEAPHGDAIRLAATTCPVASRRRRRRRANRFWPGIDKMTCHSSAPRGRGPSGSGARDIE